MSQKTQIYTNNADFRNSIVLLRFVFVNKTASYLYVT